MAAGLGSSAAATVAGLRLFERVTGTLEEGTLLVALAWTRLFPELWRMQRFPDQA